MTRGLPSKAGKVVFSVAVNLMLKLPTVIAPGARLEYTARIAKITSAYTFYKCVAIYICERGRGAFFKWSK